MGLAIFDSGRDVAATNVIVALALTLLLLVGATLFNESVEANESVLYGRLSSAARLMAGPSRLVQDSLRYLAAGWAALIPGTTFLDRMAGPALLLGATGIIYGFLEPGFGLNQRGAVIFISLVISQGALTLIYEGSKARLYRAYYHRDAVMGLFPACTAIAAVSVLVSRFSDFQPGIVVGFVAAARLADHRDIPVEEHGRALSRVSAVLLGVSLTAFILAIPLRELHHGNPGIWTALPEAVALTVFIACLEGLLFSLIPLRFLDGAAIWSWNRWTWLGLFVPSAALFAHVLFNRGDAYLDLAFSQRSVTGIVVLIAYLGVTFGTWAYFRRSSGGDGVAEPRPSD